MCVPHNLRTTNESEMFVVTLDTKNEQRDRGLLLDLQQRTAHAETGIQGR